MRGISKEKKSSPGDQVPFSFGLGHVFAFFLCIRYEGAGIYNGDIRFGFVIVDDKKRGMGCGRRMLELAVKYAFEILGVEKITLGVFENNEPAHMCYKAVGFRETPTGEAKFCRFFGEEWKCLELELKR